MTYERLSPNHTWRNGCVYCGEMYDIQRDHVIPTSYLRASRRQFAGDWLVTSCGECNNLLGSQLLFNVPERAAYLAIVMSRKYYRVLRAIHWDDDEMEDVGENLASAIRKDAAQRKAIERRINHMELIAAQPVDYMTGTRPAIPADQDEVLEHIDPEYASFLRRREVIRMAKKRYTSAARDAYR